MEFFVLSRATRIPSTAKNAAFLRYDRWNDQSYVTMFQVALFDEDGVRIDLENVKIGFKGQTISDSTFSKLESRFTSLSSDFFSLGVAVEYYSALSSIKSKELKRAYLKGLNDIVANPGILEEIIEEPVLSISLLRDVSLSSVTEQFRRVLSGGAIRTNYSFRFLRSEDDNYSDIDLAFRVIADSTPPTNVHALIGRNGIGKTTLLNGIIDAIQNEHEGSEKILRIPTSMALGSPIKPDYFSSVVLVSFSAFDPFDPPLEQVDPAKGTCFYYIGLKTESANGIELKRRESLNAEFLDSLKTCVKDSGKKARLLDAVETLQSDENFLEVGFSELLLLRTDRMIPRARELFSTLSSGHAVVLLTITRLVERVEEKTLVLLDEPESHLHPPLLSAFVRALSELLLDRNGVSIIATHSPVVLQEVPRTCAWVIERLGTAAKAIRPTIETFGENVGVLTREVFGLEVKSSGFHTLLQKHVDKGKSLDEIVEDFGGRLGFEAQAILRVLISKRKSKAQR
ncbi:AAA family ATPase [Pseudomonas oryzihabitans]|uniref:AAA family ATPase n=1 Tax=Pseudomonas oryzihabitans TaxID=47885 RepID=UPI00285DB8F9|nr:AAA family ATPase [Pseudomonas psychrotolerans]MDR6679511.1 putative ATPase [Pseudomonas psychrotolerans]